MFFIKKPPFLYIIIKSYSILIINIFFDIKKFFSYICIKMYAHKKALAFVQQLFNFESRINRFDFF
ncbi:hypothetical protein HMPREF1344_00076 [Enterococcus faecalis R508]|nr:hypothetical protein HMPREF1344_00076 [Enterococcus faecalis R508]